jgi:hypothetical protein
MKKNIVKYLQGVNVSQLTLAEKTEVKNLSRATPNLVISQSSPSRIWIYVRKINPAVSAKHKWLVTVLKETLYYAFSLCI